MKSLLRVTLILLFTISLSGCMSCDGSGGGDTPEPPPELTAPQNIVATIAGKSIVSLNWDLVPQADYYKITRYLNNKSYDPVELERKFSPQKSYSMLKADSKKLSYNDEPKYDPGTYELMYVVTAVKVFKNEFNEDQEQTAAGKTKEALNFVVDDLTKQIVPPPPATPPKASPPAVPPKTDDVLLMALLENRFDLTRLDSKLKAEIFAMAVFVNKDARYSSGKDGSTPEKALNTISAAIMAKQNDSKKKYIFITGSQSTYNENIILDKITDLSIFGGYDKNFERTTDKTVIKNHAADKPTISVLNSTNINLSGVDIQNISDEKNVSLKLFDSSNVSLVDSYVLSKISQSNNKLVSSRALEISGAKTKDIKIINNIIIAENFAKTENASVTSGISVENTSNEASIKLINNLIYAFVSYPEIQQWTINTTGNGPSTSTSQTYTSDNRAIAILLNGSGTSITNNIISTGLETAAEVTLFGTGIDIKASKKVDAINNNLIFNCFTLINGPAKKIETSSELNNLFQNFENSLFSNSIPANFSYNISTRINYKLAQLLWDKVEAAKKVVEEIQKDLDNAKNSLESAKRLQAATQKQALELSVKINELNEKYKKGEVLQKEIERVTNEYNSAINNNNAAVERISIIDTAIFNLETDLKSALDNVKKAITLSLELWKKAMFEVFDSDVMSTKIRLSDRSIAIGEGVGSSEFKDPRISLILKKDIDGQLRNEPCDIGPDEFVPLQVKPVAEMSKPKPLLEILKPAVPMVPTVDMHRIVK